MKFHKSWLKCAMENNKGYSYVDGEMTIQEYIELHCKDSFNQFVNLLEDSELCCSCKNFKACGTSPDDYCGEWETQSHIEYLTVF